ncbi:MAG: hypothetical protein R2824_00805 [Saprospiraceae bacterium]|nr:hypothetical protein [Lewinella sp.]
MMMNSEILAAIIAALASLTVAIISLIQSSRQRKIIHNQQIDIEKIRQDHEVQKFELNARLDYEYEAKKKLYKEYEPLFFQFTEFSNEALSHIKAISWTTFQGSSNSDKWNKNAWMNKSSYFFKETIYKVFCPLASMKLINDGLNSIDVKMDEKIHIVYKLGKILHSSFHHDYILAQNMSKKIKVEKEHLEKFGQNFQLGAPFSQSYYEEWQKNVITNPEDFKGGEGIRTGQLETLLQGFFAEGANEKRIISFGEFEKKLQESDSSEWSKIAEVRFERFDPRINKVLWRILVIQACLHYIFGGIKNLKAINSDILENLTNNFFEKGRNDIDNNQRPGFKGNVTRKEEQEDIINSVEKYMKHQFKNF